MPLSPTIPYLDMSLNDFKLFLKPTEKDKILVFIIQNKEFKVVGVNLVPIKRDETGLFQKVKLNITLQVAKMLMKRNAGDNLKVFLNDKYLYEVINGKPTKIGRAV